MKSVAMAAILASYGGAAAWAASIEKSIDVNANTTVVVQIPAGKVDVSGWDNSQVKISGELSGKYQLTTADDRVELVVENKPKGAQAVSDELHILVPKAAQVRVSGSRGDISLAGIDGGVLASSVDGDITGAALASSVKLNSVNGDVLLNDSSGEIDLETVNGTVRLVGSSGEAQLKNVSGDLNVAGDVRSLSASTVSGGVNASIERIKQLKLNTVNGDVVINSALAQDATVAIESVNGDIGLYLPRDVSANFSINAHRGGTISNALSAELAKVAAPGAPNQLQFALGAGSAKVSINTLSGNVTLGVLARADAASNDDNAKEFDWSDVDRSFFDFAYLRPGTQFSGYKKIYIDEPEVSFDEAWLKKFHYELHSAYTQRVISEYGAIFKRELIEYFSKSGQFELVDARGSDVLVVLPKVKKLNIEVPETPGMKENVYSYAGDATMDLAIYSPRDKAVLALFVDRRQTARLTGAEVGMKTRVINERAFRKLFALWAKHITGYLEKGNS